jgi:hypothetical protein
MHEEGVDRRSSKQVPGIRDGLASLRNRADYAAE